MASSAYGATYYVSTSGGGDCWSWGNACALPTALTNASGGDQIWVKAGTYGPIELKNAVKVVGGFAGSESSASQSDPVANVTIIDGGGSARCVSSEDHAASTVLRGFTIKNGVEDSLDGGGGGLAMVSSSAQIVQCVFENNTAEWWGGAVTIRGSGSPQFVNCTFRNNGWVDSQDNTNVKPIAGSAVFLEGGSPTFTNCLFHGNKSGDGAVIAIDTGTPTFLNCTMVGNEATVGSGGAVHDEGGQAVIRNSILWGNTAARYGGNIFNGPFGATTVTYSDVEGGFSGTGNVSGDPQFEDAGAGDYRIKATSPCKNTGRNSDLPLDVADLDFDGNTSETLPKDLLRNPRKLYTTVDMGALEYMECDEDSDCTVFPKLLCRMTDRVCVHCLNDGQCPSGYFCQPDGTCAQAGGWE
jgi:hypothetical protein